MADIRKGETLELNNLLSFRGKVNQAELESIGSGMENILKQLGVQKAGNPITATFGIEGELIDMEILIPVNKPVSSIGNYVYKEKLLITNALVAKHVGSPKGLQQTCNELNQYIMENKLMPITVGYNVTRRVDMLNPGNTEIDVYVGINPNIL